MNQKQLHRLKSKSTGIPTTLHIGKNQITDAIITEINNQFKHTDLIKIRFLKGFREDKKDAAARIAELTGSELIDLRGNTAVLHRRKR